VVCGEGSGVTSGKRAEQATSGVQNEQAVPGDATLLFDAVIEGDHLLVQRLIDAGADINAADLRSPHIDGATALILAADGGQADLTRLLLKLGADANTRSASGWTALMRACNAGQIETARILLEAGADANLANDEGYTAYGRVPGDNGALLDLLADWKRR